MLQAVICQSPDYSGEAARQPSNGSFDSSAPTLLWLPPFQWQEYVKESRIKKRVKCRERCVERKGTLRGRDGRNGTWGNGREETRRRGKMKGPEKVLRWKRKRRATLEKRQTRRILSPNKTLYLFLFFILLAECWHSPALLSRKPRAVLPVCVWQGGSWGLKFSRSRSEPFFDGGMLLFAVAYSQPVGNTSLGFPQLASCEIKAAPSPPEHIYISP